MYHIHRWLFYGMQCLGMFKFKILTVLFSWLIYYLNLCLTFIRYVHAYVVLKHFEGFNFVDGKLPAIFVSLEIIVYIV